VPIVSVYNEDQKCDCCGQPPVQFIQTMDDSDEVKSLCETCFSMKQYKRKEGEDVSNNL
jgi:hypothetical protein